MRLRLALVLSGLAVAAACSRPDPSAYCDNALAFEAANASKMAQCPGAAAVADGGPPATAITCTSVLNGSSCTSSDESLLAMAGTNLPSETTCVNGIAPDPSDGGVDCLVGVQMAEAACQATSENILTGGALSLSSQCQDALATINTDP